MSKRCNWDGTVMWKECWTNVYQIVQDASLATKQHKTSWSTTQALINNIQETVRSRGSTLAEANNQRCWRRYTDRPLGLPVKRYKVLEEIGLHTALKVLLLLLLSRWARQVLPMKGRGSRRGEGTDAPKRWEILPSCRCAGKHLICQWSHQSTIMYIRL